MIAPPPPGTAEAAADARLLACHDCDLLHRWEPAPPGGKALCTRCGAVLYRGVADPVARTLALHIAALVLFTIAHAFPFLALKVGGRVEENLVISGVLAFHRLGMGELALLVFGTSVLFPFLIILGMLYLSATLALGLRPPGVGPVYRLLSRLNPWSLVGVFLLGVLVSIVKLWEMAEVITGVSLYAFAALLMVLSAGRESLDRTVLWPPAALPGEFRAGDTATARGLAVCHTCGLLTPLAEGAHAPCPRCATPLHRRKAHSLERTLALLIAATLLLLPANLYPVMTVIRLGQGEPNTILSGVTHLIEAGMWGLALLIFFASIVVPATKLIILGGLLYSIRRGLAWRPRDRTQLYRLTEVVGAWSMVDVFLVGILIALVNFDALATIRPGIGVSFFGAVVVLTMIAAHCFDPRLIWDHAGRPPR
jgi:paraquat-inducible protein A